jgi:hypothetical protein
MRRVAVTVRCPGASIAPNIRICTRSQTRFEKSPVNAIRIVVHLLRKVGLAFSLGGVKAQLRLHFVYGKWIKSR